jgi:hypothetical protein
MLVSVDRLRKWFQVWFDPRLAREDRSKLRIALTHFAKNIALGAVVPGTGRIGSESDRDFPDVQIQHDFTGRRIRSTI